MKHLVVTEGVGLIPIKESDDRCLTQQEADELLEYIVSGKLDPDNIILNHNEVIFINYVGFIQLSSCSIEILPKVNGDNEQSRSVLFHLLNCTGFIDIHESELGNLSVFKENLLEILGFVFMKKLTMEIKKGLFHYYVVENEQLNRIRGKVDVKKQILNFASKSSAVACEFDNFVLDHPLNQLFKLTMMTLLRNVKFHETQRLIRSSMVNFEEVSLTTMSTYQLKNIHFNRNNQRFYNSYILARLILSGTSSLFQNGLTKSFSILFKMNELFEQYIAYLVKKVITDVAIKDRSYKLLVNENTGYKNFTLEPDLLINKIQDNQLIIDTKWKKYNPNSSSHGVQRNDLYQMYAYLTRYHKVQTVILLYPYDHSSYFKSGECLNIWHLEGNTNKKLKCYTINFENEKQAIDEIRQMLKVNM